LEKRLKKIIILFIFFLAQSCVTNPPVEKEIINATVVVNSNVSGASIFLDNINTGKLTPDSLIVGMGLHEIRLEKDEYISESKNIDIKSDKRVELDFVLLKESLQKIVLLEDFANVSCDPCVASNLILHKLSQSSYDNTKLAIIKNPTNFPSSTDPFYLANPSDCNERISYYNVLFAPTIWIDGILRPIASDSNSIKEKIEERLNEPADFDISVSHNYSSDTISIIVNLNVIDDSGIDLTKLVLHNVVTEEEIEFSTPPGSNGETIFYHVMRKMLPNNTGESLSNISGIGTVEYNFQSAVDPVWNLSKIHVVSFIQNTETKEVYQTGFSF
jgi:hypothetical protein